MHTHTHPAAIVLPAQAGEPRRLPPPIAAAAQRRTLRVQGLPCQGVGAGPAPPLPCFPLSISGHPSPRPSASVRLAPWQIRLVPLCRRFRRPPAGPSDHRPASAWQIRLTTLPLSTCPSRLNPKLRRVAPGRTSRKKRTAQFKASQSPGEGWNEGDRGERSCRRSLAEGESRGGNPSGKGSGGCAPIAKNVRGRVGGPNQRRNAALRSQ